MLELFSFTDLVCFRTISIRNKLPPFHSYLNQSILSIFIRRLLFLKLFVAKKNCQAMAALKRTIIFAVELLFVCSIVLASDIPGFDIPGGKNQLTNKDKVDSLIKNITTYLQEVSDQEHLEFELVRHHWVTFEVQTGITYHVMAELKEHGNKYNCLLVLHEKPWENYAKFNVDCPEKGKYEWLKDDTKREKRSPNGFGGFGGYSDISSDKLHEYHSKVTPYFTQLRAEKPEVKYEIVRIISGKSQVIAGWHGILKVEVRTNARETKECTLDLWEPISDDEYIEIECPNEPKHHVKKLKK